MIRVYVCKPGPNDGACWFLKVKMSGKVLRRFSSKTTDHALALRIAAKEEALANEGLPAGPPRTVGHVFSAYLAHVRATMKPGTATSTGVCLQRLDPLAGIELSRLRPGHVVKVRDSMKARLDGKTVNLTLGKAEMAFRWANENESTSVQFPRVTRARAKRTKKEPNTPDQVRLILGWFEDYADGFYAPVVHALLEAGARAGEVLTMKGRQVLRSESLFYFGETKTGEPRYSGITRATMARVPKVGPDEWVFTSKERPYQPLSVNTLSLMLKRAREQLGIVGPYDLHSLRRTHTTEAERAGVAERVAMKQQGHRSVTQHRAYKERARGDDLVAAAEQTAARWAPSTNPAPPSTAIAAQLADSGRSSSSQWLNADHGPKTLPVQLRALWKATQHRTVAPSSAKSRSVATGQVLGFVGSDPWAKRIGRWVDSDPEAAAACFTSAVRMRVVQECLIESGHIERATEARRSTS